MSELEATALMTRYCGGERAAFHGLYSLLAARVLGYLVGLVGDRATAEDLLQQTFLKVHEARAIYVRGANPVPWIYTIAHRTFIDEARRRKRAHVRLTSDGALPNQAPAELDGRPIEMGRDGASTRGEAALAALERLPRNQKEALLLTKVHGQSLAEAAAITGSSPGAIKLRAHRAYVTLRQRLAPAARAVAVAPPETRESA